MRAKKKKSNLYRGLIGDVIPFLFFFISPVSRLAVYEFHVFRLCKIRWTSCIDWLIDWLVFNANFRSISTISWREQFFLINLDICKTLRNKTYLYIKQAGYIYLYRGRTGLSPLKKNVPTVYIQTRGSQEPV